MICLSGWQVLGVTAALAWGGAGAFWPPEWNVSLRHEEVFEVVDVRLDEGFGGEGDEMVHAADVRSLGLQLDDARLRPFHELIAHDPRRRNKHSRMLPVDAAAVSSQEEAALAQEAVREMHLMEEDYAGGSLQRERPNPVLHVALRSAAPDATKATESQTTGEETTTEAEYDYARLSAEKAEREEAAIRAAGLLRTTDAPPPRKLTWRAWFAREFLAWGSFRALECSRIGNWRLTMRGARCYFWDLVDVLSGPGRGPSSQRLQDARVSASRLMRPVTLHLVVYLSVAVPLWCSRGWCCCCFYCCCRFCRPDATLLEVKVFFAKNPPGTWEDPDSDEPVHYSPSEREVETYLAFQKKLRDTLLY